MSWFPVSFSLCLLLHLRCGAGFLGVELCPRSRWGSWEGSLPAQTCECSLVFKQQGGQIPQNHMCSLVSCRPAAAGRGDICRCL